MIKRDWSVIKITILLYFIVLLIPINYYFVKNHFDDIKNDANTMNHLVFISGSLPILEKIDTLNDRDILIKQVDDSLETIEQTFINYAPNREYVELFYADESYSLLKQSYEDLKRSLKNKSSTKSCTNRTFNEVNAFSKTAQNMMSYKSKVILDRLYLSLAFTMISIVLLVFFVRFFIKMQLLKHAIHDDLTGLYNKKYFDNVLKNIQLLETRQEKPLSLLIISITNYDEIKESLDNKSFEKEIKEFAEAFSHFFRLSDTVCRIEENCFASITPGAASENITKLSTKLERDLLSKLLKTTMKINISIGVATYDKNSPTPLLEEAKKSMKKSHTLSLGGA